MKLIRFDLTVNGFPVRAEYTEDCVEGVLKPLLCRFLAAGNAGRQERNSGAFEENADPAAANSAVGRRLIFLAAPPGAGKSTLGKVLEALSGEQLQCLSIDGFHRTNAELEKLVIDRPEGAVRGRDIKGAPETYDLGKLEKKLRELRENTSGGSPVLFPVYDRNLHDPVPDAEKVTAPVILLEGNWLLYQGSGWERLRKYADLTIFLDAEEELLREDLIARKMRGGRTRAEAEAWYDSTDGPNIRKARTNRAAADLELKLTDRHRLMMRTEEEKDGF